MKAISLLQPWATLVAIGAKKIETRSWNTKYRGEILIHASKKKDVTGRNYALYNKYFYEALQAQVEFKGFDELPFGAIIGKATITTTEQIQTLFKLMIVQPKELLPKEQAFGLYTDERYAWHLENAVQFLSPIECKGSLSLWDCPIKICKQCGCTDYDCRHCIARTGQPCYWVEENLCSACKN